MDANYALAVKVLEALSDQGVRDFCICPGARNAPFVFVLDSAKGIRVHSFFDERSAGFFALGKAKSTGLPVAVICTSGTAVAELLPSAVEATYSGVPLIFVTADRPRSYRGKGAPQSIDQVGIFFKYVETCWDLESIEDDFRISDWTKEMPLQINVCFDEPLTTNLIPQLDFSKARVSETAENKIQFKNKAKIKNPLIIVSELPDFQSNEVLEFLLELGSPIYLETISQLRGHATLRNNLIIKSEKTLSNLLKENICDSVLRIGGVPTCRFWRDLESTFRMVPVYSCSKDEWVGLSRSVRHIKGIQNLSSFEIIGSKWTEEKTQEVSQIDLNFYQKMIEVTKELPRSELALLGALAKKLKAESIYLGNSLPIREWDMVYWPAQTDTVLPRFSANRGANGIDGQISTFLGWSRGESWAVLGDLTALYDVNAFWLTSKLSMEKRRLVVVNNQGGQIFNKMFSNPAFINKHSIDFKAISEQWGWTYQTWTSIPENLEFAQQNIVIELKPDSKESEESWRRL